MEASAIRSEEVIEGIVNAILWRDESTKTVIASLEGKNIPKFAQQRGYPNCFSAIGTFLRIGKGQNLKLKGYWNKDRKGRWSFRANGYEEIIPTDDNSMVDYLASGLFKGVGKKTAQAIVDLFGTQSLEVIKNEPHKLERVRGISKAKAEKIADDYLRNEHMEKLIMSLKQYNIPTNLIIKIHKKYGKDAVKKIEDNPYRLCEDIEGIGFRMADLIAYRCKKSHNDDFRIRASIAHTLKECSMIWGHSYLPYDRLLIKTKEVLEFGEISGEVKESDIAKIFIDMLRMEEIISEGNNDVYLPLLFNSEKSCANKVRILLKNKPKKFNLDTEETIRILEKEQKIEYANKQKETFRKLDKCNMMIVTGGPGTGKTTIIKGIIDIYKKNFPESKILLAAPTGRAAKRMEEATKLKARTIHRQLEYKPSDDGNIKAFRDEKNPLDADLIIVDESSMIDILLFSTFLKAIKPTTSLIMVGDIDQLPSVGAGNVLKDLIESKKVPVVCLNEIFRQKDTSKIITNSTLINNGNCDLDFSKDFVFIEENDPTLIPEVIKRSFKKELERIKDINEVQVLSPFRRKTESGVNQLNQVLQEDLNIKDKNKPEIIFRRTSFRKYDKIMQYKNNYDKDVYNGDVGIIYDVVPDEGKLLVKIDDEMVEYYKDELDEIQLAYSTTIHKSQGSEYDTVIIPLTMQHKIMLQRNLLYTGITRAKNKVILIGSKKALDYAIRNNTVNKRYSKLEKRI